MLPAPLPARVAADRSRRAPANPVALGGARPVRPASLEVLPMVEEGLERGSLGGELLGVVEPHRISLRPEVLRNGWGGIPLGSGIRSNRVDVIVSDDLEKPLEAARDPPVGRAAGGCVFGFGLR